jgi:hypothetical protein
MNKNENSHSFNAQKQMAAPFYVLLQNIRIKASFMLSFL